METKTAEPSPAHLPNVPFASRIFIRSYSLYSTIQAQLSKEEETMNHRIFFFRSSFTDCFCFELEKICE